MKRIVMFMAVILVLIFISQTNTATVPLSTFGDFVEGVRYQLNVSSTNAIPDTVLFALADRAIVHTSCDIGGNEANFIFAISSKKAHYPLADSLTAVLAVNLFNADSAEMHSAMLWNPEFWERDFPLNELSSAADEDQLPLAYSINSDTMQFFPFPVKNDTAYIYTLVTHSSAWDGTDYDSTQTVRLKPKVAEAAMFYACALVEIAYGGGRSEAFMALYANIKAEVKMEYMNKYGRYWKRN